MWNKHGFDGQDKVSMTTFEGVGGDASVCVYFII